MFVDDPRYTAFVDLCKEYLPKWRDKVYDYELSNGDRQAYHIKRESLQRALQYARDAFETELEFM